MNTTNRTNMLKNRSEYFASPINTFFKEKRLHVLDNFDVSNTHNAHDMQFYGFPCEIDFSHHESPNLRQVVRNLSPISKTIQNAFSRILCTSRHVNHVKYTVQS